MKGLCDGIIRKFINSIIVRKLLIAIQTWKLYMVRQTDNKYFLINDYAPITLISKNTLKLSPVTLHSIEWWKDYGIKLWN